MVQGEPTGTTQFSKNLQTEIKNVLIMDEKASAKLFYTICLLAVGDQLVS